MSTYERRALVLSVLATLLGLGAAFAFSGSHFFARSGAVILVIAIVFGSLELRERLARAPAFVEEKLRNSRAELLKQGTESGLISAAAAAIVSQVETEVRNEVGAEVQKASKRVLRVEVSLLVAGTLIWGFGDLAIDALLRHYGG
jgi:hypothetical protein